MTIFIPRKLSLEFLAVFNTSSGTELVLERRLSTSGASAQEFQDRKIIPELRPYTRAASPAGTIMPSNDATLGIKVNYSAILDKKIEVITKEDIRMA